MPTFEDVFIKRDPLDWVLDKVDAFIKSEPPHSPAPLFNIDPVAEIKKGLKKALGIKGNPNSNRGFGTPTPLRPIEPERPLKPVAPLPTPQYPLWAYHQFQDNPLPEQAPPEKRQYGYEGESKQQNVRLGKGAFMEK